MTRKKTAVFPGLASIILAVLIKLPAICLSLGLGVSRIFWVLRFTIVLSNAIRDIARLCKMLVLLPTRNCFCRAVLIWPVGVSVPARYLRVIEVHGPAP